MTTVAPGADASDAGERSEHMSNANMQQQWQQSASVPASPNMGIRSQLSATVWGTGVGTAFRAP